MHYENNGPFNDYISSNLFAKLFEKFNKDSNTLINNYPYEMLAFCAFTKLLRHTLVTHYCVTYPYKSLTNLFSKCL